MKNEHTLIISVILGCVALIFVGICFDCFYILNPGKVAIHLRLGRIMSEDKVPGFYTKIPFIDTIHIINVRIQKCIIETESLSKDLQSVSIGIALNYQIEDASMLYKEVGVDFEQVIINPLAQESIKAIVARYTAEELIQQRHEAKEQVLNDIRERLIPRYIKLVDFNFVHLDFHDEFMKAVEDKQIAQQAAMTERNLTEKVKQQIIQKKSLADAEAYSLEVVKQSITPAIIEIKKIEKWDGKLPLYSGNSIPLISLGK
jgi:regulator of protease activity HflC (stomatin/prohibitin superfamily)